jgi:Carboxypeptidase regulatory-like domain
MATYPMSQADLYLLLPLAWQHYADHQKAFGAYKKTKYTPALADEAMARIEAAMKLPSLQARGAMPESTRIELVQQTDEFLDAWNLLDGYIEETFKADGTYKAMRDAAGAKLYEKAADHDWGAAKDMVNLTLAFVATNEAVLKAKGDMDDAFVATLQAEGEDVRRVVQRYMKQQQEAEDGTNAKVKANEACFAEYQTMSADAQRIFRQKPEVARLFQAQALLATIRGTRQAGIRGVVIDADGLAVADATVTVPAVADATAVTDVDGRYFLPLASGIYTVVVRGEGFKEQTLTAVEVAVGVKKRMDIRLD